MKEYTIVYQKESIPKTRVLICKDLEHYKDCIEELLYYNYIIDYVKINKEISYIKKKEPTKDKEVLKGLLLSL